MTNISGNANVGISDGAHVNAEPVWVRQLIQDAAGLRLDDRQAEEILAQAERRLSGLLDVAKEAAVANSRTMIFWHDLPLTKGMRSVILEYTRFSDSLPAQAVESYLRDIGILDRIEESARERLPRLFVALVILVGRLLATLTPLNVSAAERVAWLIRAEADIPTQAELERAQRILDLTL
jgi:hypothetical protein